MRDSHRLKEKYELSLDTRQIGTITVASLVVIGGVFFLGVVVGKKLAVEAHASVDAQPVDLLSQLDKKTEALETVKADAALTFQDELTRRAPAPVPVVEAPKPVEPPRPVEAPKPAEVAKAPEAAAPTPVAVAEAPRPAPVEPTPAPAPEAKLPETPKPEPVATRTHDGGGLKEAFGKVQRTPETAADGSWTVQLSAYQDKGEADRFAAGLRDKGYAPYIVEANIPGKGTWFRVRMGRFPSKDAATRYMDDFRRETAMPAIVTTAN